MTSYNHPALPENAPLRFPLNPIAASIAQDLQQKQSEGNHLFFLTATYKASANYDLTLTSIEKRLEQVYKALLREVVHRCNFNRPKYRPLQPHMYAFADRPGSKGKQTDVTVSNDTSTLHHHALIIAVPDTAGKLLDLCSDSESRDRFLNDCRVLKTFDLQPIAPTDPSIEKVTSYAVGNDLHSTTWSERMVVFPHADSEFKNGDRMKKPKRLNATTPERKDTNETRVCP